MGVKRGQSQTPLSGGQRKDKRQWAQEEIQEILFKYKKKKKQTVFTLKMSNTGIGYPKGHGVFLLGDINKLT